VIPYAELWVLSVSSLLSGVAPGDWQEVVPLADAMATRLLDMAGLPKPGGVHPADEEVRLDLARARAETQTRGKKKP
jgi:hypothetical protein